MKQLTRKQLFGLGVGVLALVVVIGGVVLGGNGNGFERFVVERRDLVDDVNIAGSVEAGTVSDIGFEVSGRVVEVFVSEGDAVESGQPLVRLDLGTLTAELLSAQANVKIKESEVANSQTNLGEVIAKQNTLVDNAYRTLLSEGLVAEAQDDTYIQTPPNITGLYIGSEGTYKMIVKHDVSRDRRELLVFGIESTGPVTVHETKATPLGTKGLFVSLPDGTDSYDDTTWFIDVPNKKSAVYAANYNAYQETLRTRDSAIEEANARVKEQQAGSSIVQAELLQAQAEVARIQAEIQKRTLTAPFDGVITQVEVDPGEIVSANTEVISLISTDDFGIEIDLPEVDSVKVQNGDAAQVTLDAFGDDVFFDAAVVSVNRTETIVNNVAVYEARLLFNEQDDRITSGMTADVTITTNTRTNVLAIPARALQFHEDGRPFVFVARGGDKVASDVVLGLRGSDGFIEILSGLSEGDTVLIPKI